MGQWPAHRLEKVSVSEALEQTWSAIPKGEFIHALEQVTDESPLPYARARIAFKKEEDVLAALAGEERTQRAYKVSVGADKVTRITVTGDQFSLVTKEFQVRPRRNGEDGMPVREVREAVCIERSNGPVTGFIATVPIELIRGIEVLPLPEILMN